MAKNQTTENYAVDATTIITHWSQEAEKFCQRLAAVVVENTDAKARPSFFAYRHERHDWINLRWSSGKTELMIGWSPSYKLDLDNADLTPRQGFIEISVPDNTDAILLSQRIIDLVSVLREENAEQ